MQPDEICSRRPVRAGQSEARKSGRSTSASRESEKLRPEGLDTTAATLCRTKGGVPPEKTVRAAMYATGLVGAGHHSHRLLVRARSRNGPITRGMIHAIIYRFGRRAAGAVHDRDQLYQFACCQAVPARSSCLALLGSLRASTRWPAGHRRRRRSSMDRSLADERGLKRPRSAEPPEEGVSNGLADFAPGSSGPIAADDDEEDDVGPMPLPANSVEEASDAGPRRKKRKGEGLCLEPFNFP